MKKKYSQEQIEALKNLPPCRICGDKVDTKRLITLTTRLNLYHACGDDSSTIVSLQGSFDYVVQAWLAVNGGRLSSIFEDVKRGYAAADSAFKMKSHSMKAGYRRGWRDSLQQLANIIEVKYGGGDG